MRFNIKVINNLSFSINLILPESNIPSGCGVRQTESMSNLSDMSSSNAPASSSGGAHTRPRLEVVCVIDTTHSTENLQHRKCALEEIKQACGMVNANLQRIQFEKLDFGETTVLETFYNADVAVVDFSIQIQQSALSYHLGVRESFGMRENIVTYNDSLAELTLRMKISCENYNFLPYKFVDGGGDGQSGCLVTNLTNGSSGSDVHEGHNSKQSLAQRLKKFMQDVEVTSK